MALLARIGLGNLMGLIPGAQAQSQGFPKTLTKQDFGLTSDVTVQAGKWNKIGEFKVPPQQAYRYGFGDAAHPDNQGYVYVALKDGTGAEIKGKIRFVTSDANEFNKKVVYEERNEVLSASKTDRKLMRAFPEQGDIVHEDDRLILEYLPDNDATISATNSELLIPVTVYVR